MIERIIPKVRSPFTQKGFTLLELIVVFSIIAILSTIGLASFVSYSKSQTLQSGLNDVTSVLNTAKSKASAQIIPDLCSGSLVGYGVSIFKSANGSHPANSYTLEATCSGSGVTQISSTNLPSGVSFNAATNTPNIFFSVLTGAVITGAPGNGNIVLSGFSLPNKTITVNSLGVIQ
jgi:prepilin-type N-terminal cleavage/methylation domain-containing protein